MSRTFKISIFDMYGKLNIAKFGKYIYKDIYNTNDIDIILNDDNTITCDYSECSIYMFVNGIKNNAFTINISNFTNVPIKKFGDVEYPIDSSTDTIDLLFNDNGDIVCEYSEKSLHLFNTSKYMNKLQHNQNNKIKNDILAISYDLDLLIKGYISVIEYGLCLNVDNVNMLAVNTRYNLDDAKNFIKKYDNTFDNCTSKEAYEVAIAFIKYFHHTKIGLYRCVLTYEQIQEYHMFAKKLANIIKKYCL